MNTAVALGDAGAALAAEHADQVNPGWTEEAASLFEIFLIVHAENEFRTEEVRSFAESCGLCEPPDPRAWGAIAKMMRRRGLIKRVGWTSAKTPRSHGGPRTIWTAA